ncbi:redoxin domain-containing protein [Conexibacter sp. DBS9H8]|uniref:redoxin domain-containing protein n=1 Tax=Conexibacter sp. DBS9H8 TaxID=2937801 RepID=UPI00200FE390|nr:redoxin domain-containing protein [Conexibacter sp. DBS9H8]
MRAPDVDIFAPEFPAQAPWIGGKRLWLAQLRGHPFLLEFWDFCRPSSLRTLPYLTAWQDRYGEAGLRTVGVHASGFPPSADVEAVAAAVARLGIAYPVLVDVDFTLWQEYGNLGWPARYLFDAHGRLFDYHYGEGGYGETEAAIRELLGFDHGPDGRHTGVPDHDGAPEPVGYLRAEDDPAALLVIPTPDAEGATSGPYEAGSVWAVIAGTGTLEVNGETRRIDHPGAHQLISHSRSTAATLEICPGPGVEVLATCFLPGLAPDGSTPTV